MGIDRVERISDVRLGFNDGLKYPLKRRRRKRQSVSKEEVDRLVELGRSPGEIAKLLGCSLTTVYCRLRGE